MKPIPLLVVSKPLLTQYTLYSDSSINPLRNSRITGGMLNKLLSGVGLDALTARAYEKQLARFDALGEYTWESMCRLFRMTVEQAEQLLEDNVSLVKKITKALSPKRISEWSQHRRTLTRLYSSSASKMQIQAYTAKFHNRFFGCFRFVTKKCRRAIEHLAALFKPVFDQKTFDEAADYHVNRWEELEEAERQRQKQEKRDKHAAEETAAKKKIELDQHQELLRLRRAKRA